MVDEYVLTTSRESDRGVYRTELTYNGKKVDFPLPDNLKEIIDEQGFRNIRILADNPKINQLELVISGEDLR